MRQDEVKIQTQEHLFSCWKGLCQCESHRSCIFLKFMTKVRNGWFFFPHHHEMNMLTQICGVPYSGFCWCFNRDSFFFFNSIFFFRWKCVIVIFWYLVLENSSLVGRFQHQMFIWICLILIFLNGECAIGSVVKVIVDKCVCELNDFYAK